MCVTSWQYFIVGVSKYLKLVFHVCHFVEFTPFCAFGRCPKKAKRQNLIYECPSQFATNFCQVAKKDLTSKHTTSSSQKFQDTGLIA